jgi:hypothetical protein
MKFEFQAKHRETDYSPLYRLIAYTLLGIVVITGLYVYINLNGGFLVEMALIAFIGGSGHLVTLMDEKMGNTYYDSITMAILYIGLSCLMTYWAVNTIISSYRDLGFLTIGDAAVIYGIGRLLLFIINKFGEFLKRKTNKDEDC